MASSFRLAILIAASIAKPSSPRAADHSAHMSPKKPGEAVLRDTIWPKTKKSAAPVPVIRQLGDRLELHRLRPIVPETIITCEFTVRSGTLRYISTYTPEARAGNLPHAWWHGNAPIQMRVKKNTLFTTHRASRGSPRWFQHFFGLC